MELWNKIKKRSEEVFFELIGKFCNYSTTVRLSVLSFKFLLITCLIFDKVNANFVRKANQIIDQSGNNWLQNAFGDAPQFYYHLFIIKVKLIYNF